jgi:hypothetical protein
VHLQLHARLRYSSGRIRAGDIQLFENIWMNSSEYAKHLAERRVLVNDFMQAIGLAGK